jgi:uncharacterized protein (DUF1778 family)
MGTPRLLNRTTDFREKSANNSVTSNNYSTGSRILTLCGSLPYNAIAGDMMIELMTKTARLEARITPDLQALLKRAAELEGRSVSDFVITAAQEAAERRVEQAQVIRLSLEDQRAFVDAILNPPEPTPGLRRAFRLHRELIKESR